jgi:hypothetical protein
MRAGKAPDERVLKTQLSRDGKRLYSVLLPVENTAKVTYEWGRKEKSAYNVPQS